MRCTRTSAKGAIEGYRERGVLVEMRPEFYRSLRNDVAAVATALTRDEINACVALVGEPRVLWGLYDRVRDQRENPDGRRWHDGPRVLEFLGDDDDGPVWSRNVAALRGAQIEEALERLAAELRLFEY